MCEEERVVMLNDFNNRKSLEFSGAQLLNKFWFLDFCERKNLKYPGNNLSEQSTEPTN